MLSIQSSFVSVQAISSGDEKILECIDKGIDVFGTSVKNVIYWRFQTVYSHERKDIIRKPELFAECLRSFFGERSFSVEAAIVTSIANKLHPLDVRISDSLVRAIEEARKQSRS